MTIGLNINMVVLVQTLCFPLKKMSVPCSGLKPEIPFQSELYLSLHFHLIALILAFNPGLTRTNCKCLASPQITLHPGANLHTATGDLLTFLAQVPVLDECDKSICVIMYVSTQSKIAIPCTSPHNLTNLRVTSSDRSLLLYSHIFTTYKDISQFHHHNGLRTF